MKLLLLSTLFLSSFTAFAEPTRIIGKDTRVKITDQKAKAVHDSIGMLLMEFDGDNYGMCTGTVVGTRSVVTAAHCLYSSKYGMAKAVQFVPALREPISAEKLPYGVYSSSKVRVLSAYINSQLSENDLGLVSFSENLPVNALKVRAAKKAETNIVIAGYPGDKEDGELWEGRGSTLPYLFKINPAYYNVDTFNGQSGSAIRTAGGAENEIIGIHSEGRDLLVVEYNAGFIFKKETVATLYKWIEEDK